MCGISGYIGSRDAACILYDALTILQNRGYDSCGIVTCNNEGEDVCVTKCVSQNVSDAIEHLEQVVHSHGTNNIGIAHTRWATHGGKTERNAHPQFDESRRIFVVHNGIIDNYRNIKEDLIGKGVVFVSETDTEVIAQLIGYYMREMEDIALGVKAALNRLEGTWGLLVLDVHNPDKLVVARKGSPMFIGIGREEMYVASEIAAFGGSVDRCIALKDGEIIIVTPDKSDIDISRVESVSTEDKILLSPKPYKYWTEKEIMEQDITIQAALNNGGRISSSICVKLGGLDQEKELFKDIKNLILLGCGTSYYACLYASKLMRLFSTFASVQVVEASEFTSSYLNAPDCAVLLVSQSGETRDLLRCLDIIENNTSSVVSFAVVNRVGSLLSRRVKCGVYLNAGREVGVASTKSFTSQVIVLSLIACWFSQMELWTKKTKTLRKQIIEQIIRVPSYCHTLLVSESLNNKCEEIAKSLSPKNHCFILGKGFGEAIAKEAALKIKEITYLHAEGFPGGALKHGPFALIDEGTPVILLVLNNEDRYFMESTIHEVKARGAYTIIISDIGQEDLNHDIIDDYIFIPHNGHLTSLMGIFPLQLIAYRLAIQKGLNPDRPKNLAKTVTVH